MYIVLTGAKKNIGDFIITERCKALLREHRPEHELIQLPSWEGLESHLDIIKKSSAVIIMGGPGFQRNFYPSVYRLTDDLQDIKTPIFPMGLGWKGFPGDDTTLKNHRFTKSALKAAKYIAQSAAQVGCRDNMTLRLLEAEGIKNAVMTGCPVWYDIPSLGKPLLVPKSISTLVFTPPQNPMFMKQSLKVAKLLAKLFPEAKKICSFHRGIDGPSGVIKKHVEELGYSTIDSSSDLKSISFYDECDIHVGYRLHAHLYFLSKRRPSFLLHEDGRGIAMSMTLGSVGVDAAERTALGRLLGLVGFPEPYPVRYGGFGTVRTKSNATEELEDAITGEMADDFPKTRSALKKIDEKYEAMKTFIFSLP